MYTGSSNAEESWLGVPILAGDRVLGVISLERLEQYGFSEADERLLSTLASSLGQALENARLFDETRRLLSETEQRNAELAVITESVPPSPASSTSTPSPNWWGSECVESSHRRRCSSACTTRPRT